MGGEQNMSKDFEEIVNDTLRLWKVPGVSIAIIDDHTTITKVRQHRGE